MESAVSSSLRQMQYTARIIGSKLESQVETFRKCLSTAESIELNPNRTHEMLVPLGAMMEDLQEVAAGPGHILQNHMGALSAATELFAWLTMSDPSVAVSEAKEKAAPFISALRSMDHSLHREFGNAVHSFLSQASDYITIKHKTGLMFVATGEPQSNGKAESTLEISDKFTAHHLMYVKEKIFLGSLKEYVSVSSSLGDVVSKQTTAVVDAFKELYNFIVKASDSKKPSSSEDLQTMLTPIGMKMGLVAEIASTCPPQDKFQNHVTAVQEAINMLSWVSADSKPISFVSDADGSSGFYLNKILTSTKSNSDASNHKAFVQSIKNLLSEMRTYIKEYHTMGVSYGIGLYAKGGSEELASQFSSSVNLEESGHSYVTAFQEIIDGSLAEYVTASNALGGEVAEQASPFARSFNAEREFLAKAYCTPKPDDIQSLLTPIANEMAAVSAVAEKADPRGPYANHCTAVSESVGALGWVAVDEKATAFVGDMAGAGQFFIDKIKMGAKKMDNPKGHRIWAKALEQLYSDLRAYVKEHHTQKLTWNPPKQKRAQRSVEKSIVNSSGDESSDYFTKFKELIDGPLSKYIEASSKLGGEVSEQATVFAAAWSAEAEFLSKAICTPKPNDVRSMLEPIAVKMGAVSAIAEKVDPRGPFANHCTAVSESVSALGWVAVDEKATSFVGDMAGAGQFFLDKVKMCAKKTEDPEAHRAWAKSLECLYAELKAYVKENHTQRLTWNPPHRAKSAQRSNPSAIVPENETGGDYVSKFREVIDVKLAPFITASNKLGGEVAGQASVFAAAWTAQADFLANAFCTPKPDDFQDMLAPLATQMGLVSAVAEKMDPRGPLANHCTAVSESVSALGWVAVDEKATAFVGDMAAAGQFYLDKVKMGAKKTKDPAGHREWAIALEELYAALKAYVKDYHTQKLIWNLANR